MVHPTVNKYKNNKNIKNRLWPIFYCLICRYLYKHLSSNITTKGWGVRGNRRFPGKGVVGVESLTIGFPTKGGCVRGNRRFPGFRYLTTLYFYPNAVFGDFVLAYFHFARLSTN